MKNYFLLICFAFMGLVAVLGWKFLGSSGKGATPKFSVAVLQTLSHPALDLVVESCSKELQKKFGSDLALTVFNGQGMISTIHTIAQRISSQRYDLAITVGTSATQALYNCQGTMPIMFAAVTDTGVFGSFDPQRMTGITDMIDLKKHVQLVKDLVPQAHKIGIINNPSDAGSNIQYQQLTKLFADAGYEIFPVVVQSIQDLGVAINQAVRSIDALLVPVDNLIAIGIAQVVSITDQHKIPVIVSDTLLVKQGPLGGCGVDYAAIGAQTAHRVVQHLLRAIPLVDLPVQSIAQSTCHINKRQFDSFAVQPVSFSYPVAWD